MSFAAGNGTSATVGPPSAAIGRLTNREFGRYLADKGINILTAAGFTFAPSLSMNTHILSIHCPDESGLIYKITKVVYKSNLNIVRNDEFVKKISTSSSYALSFQASLISSF